MSNEPKKDTLEFNPDWRSHPLDSIIEIACFKNIGFAALAVAINMDHFKLQEFLSGTVKINMQIAAGLSKVLGGSQQFWMNRQANYDKPLPDKKGKPGKCHWVAIGGDRDHTGAIIQCQGCNESIFLEPADYDHLMEMQKKNKSVEFTDFKCPHKK